MTTKAAVYRVPGWPAWRHVVAVAAMAAMAALWWFVAAQPVIDRLA